MKWLTIEEYAQRYNISLSLLRRKLESNQIEYIFSAGRYKVKDRPLYDQDPWAGIKAPMNPEEMTNKIKDLTLLLEKKTKQLELIKAHYEDLKNLTQWLEEENKSLRDLISNFQRMDEWIRSSPSADSPPS